MKLHHLIKGAWLIALAALIYCFAYPPAWFELFTGGIPGFPVKFTLGFALTTTGYRIWKVRRRRRWGVLGVYILLTLSTHFLVLKPFDPEAWRLAAQNTIKSSTPFRLSLVKDLLWSYRLIDMSREEVTKLLGEPDGGKYFKKDLQLVYWLGPQRNSSFRIDSDWLVINLDDHNRVKGFTILND